MYVCGTCGSCVLWVYCIYMALLCCSVYCTFCPYSDRFVDVYDMATLEFVMNRLLQYTMAHTYKDYRFLQRVTDTFFKYIEQRKAQGGFKMFTD